MGRGVQEFAVSARQIHSLFIDVTGVSYHRYIMNRHLEIARLKLQSDPSLSIKEVAYASGFASPAHFSSKFKSAFGVSPNEYRRRGRGRNFPIRRARISASEATG